MYGHGPNFVLQNKTQGEEVTASSQRSILETRGEKTSKSVQVPSFFLSWIRTSHFHVVTF